eukprot:CAMPEP_0177689230 /NCGR_PEP_ID=MMETSP0484_2-20121128/63_1 /TAXON_ID=354590 /ORGANISM="Rhodomonas lens, Strain RHODO" /LENGTH=555 /DNA_ID=CAMNT_0019199575 /DNA_START=68 /DNA_END=1733 /DNA_ORIENTATION=+
MRRDTLPAVLLLFLGSVASQWPSWIEVHVEDTAAQAWFPDAIAPNQRSSYTVRPAQMSLCDDGQRNATFKVAVRGGTGPWKVLILRDGEFFTRLTLHSSRFELISSGVNTGQILTAVPGTYSIGRVCDTNFCNGTVLPGSVKVAMVPIPSARVSPACTPVCLEAEESKHVLSLTGIPPFSAAFSLVGGDLTIHTTFDSEGDHQLPVFPSRGLWALTHLSQNQHFGAECKADMLTVTPASTVATTEEPHRHHAVAWGRAVRRPDPALGGHALAGEPAMDSHGRDAGWEQDVLAAEELDAARACLPHRRLLHPQSGGRLMPWVAARDVSLHPRVGARLFEVNGSRAASCQGLWTNITGQVEGTGPWSLEIYRDGSFFRRILHPAEAGPNFTFSTSAPGNYSLHAVTDGRYCSTPGAGWAVLTKLAAPELTLPGKRDKKAMEFCAGEPVRLFYNGSGIGKIAYSLVGASGAKRLELFTPLPTANRSDPIIVDLFEGQEAAPGQYSLLSVEDANCSTSLSETFTIHQRPVVTMRGMVTEVCGGQSSQAAGKLEVRQEGG